MEIKKILILGSTGQIGKELSINLKNYENINLTCHARTKVSAAFFKQKKINCLIGNIKENNIIKNIAEADLVFDLAAPNFGTLSEIKEFYKDRLDLVINNMKQKSKFVFASTMNAFGLSDNRKHLKNYFFPSSIYSANKRFAEKYCKKLGKKNSVEIYLLRLAEVHGIYQRASENLKKLIYEKHIFEIPRTPAWIIFISSIEEALINILKNKENPGLYTLTNDQIYWNDLLEYLAKKINCNVKFKFTNNKKETFTEYLKKYFHKIILSKKDFIRGNVSLPKEFEEVKKLDYRINKAKEAYSYLDGVKFYKELNRYFGKLPGKRMKSLTTEKNLILKSEDKSK